MNSTDMVTKFSLEGATAGALCTALNAHLKALGLTPQDYDFSPTDKYDSSPTPIPTKFTHLVAYWVEGDNEGYYVHIGVLLPYRSTQWTPASQQTPTYIDLGFCKTWESANAQQIATEAQRFLNATLWN